MCPSSLSERIPFSNEYWDNMSFTEYPIDVISADVSYNFNTDELPATQLWDTIFSDDAAKLGMTACDFVACVFD